MHRVMVTVAAAALFAACSDVSTAPTKALHPGVASLDRSGDPPPPPVAADGSAEFSAFFGDDDGTTCNANTTFNFSYQYLQNKNDNNAFLHIRVDGQGLDVSIHQTKNKLTANGTVTGAGFTFDINDAVSGNIMTEGSGAPSTVTVNLTGKLQTNEGTCFANATLTAHLVDVPIP